MAFRRGTLAEKIFGDRSGDQRPAFVETDGSSISHGDAARLVSEMSDDFLSLGVTEGDVVGFVSPRNPLGLMGFLAISAVAACCPLSTRQRQDEFTAALEDMGVSTLVDGCGDRNAVDAASALGLRVITCRLNGSAIELEVVNEECGANPAEIGVTPDLAVIMRTSGTTSKPKIVGLTHGNVLAAAKAIQKAYGLTDGDLCFNMMPLYHVHGLISGGVSSLVSGSCQLCTGPLPPADFAKVYSKLGPTWFTGSPPVHLALRDYYEVAGERPENDRLRFFRSSSAPFPAPAITALEELFGAPLLENYGMTETASTVCSNLMPPARRKVGGVGQSISAEIRVVDGNGNDVEQGTQAEIILRGPSVITRYLGSEEVNAANFFDDWLRTGDVGYFDADGDLFVIGRTKELIKRGGQSIYPSEVDNALSARDDISEAITFSIEHPTLGEELVAAIVPREGAQPDEQTLRNYLADEISTYKVPSAILIVDGIPKNETGKVLRRDMRAAFASDFAPSGKAPEGDTEAVLLKTWQEVLRREDIGATDNVFVFGADPLRSSRVAEVIREQLGAEISAREIFRHPTVRAQAKLLLSEH
jgi:acyl-CoA synthetase (AMP-forming)/AMP-acid ligase II